jgi:ERAP1-like C-terminal domain
VPPEYVIWQELSSNLSSLASLYRSESFYPLFQEYLRKIFAKQAETLGWDASPTDSARTGTLRGSVLRMMGVAKDQATIEAGHRRFMEIAQKESLQDAVSGDVQEVLFRLAMRHDEPTVFYALKKAYEEQPGLSPETQRDCLVVMGCVKDPKCHAEMLDYVFFSGKVRQQDTAFPLSTLADSSDEAGRSTWSYFKTNFSKLQAKFGTGPVWRACVGLSCRGLRTEAEAQEVEDFFNDPVHPAGSGARVLQQALEVIRTQAARIKRDREALSSFFGA